MHIKGQESNLWYPYLTSKHMVNRIRSRKGNTVITWNLT